MPISEYRDGLEVAQIIMSNNQIMMWGGKKDINKIRYESSKDRSLRQNRIIREQEGLS
jgi:hypothetical protein